jgi:hypothetical protein
MKMFIIQRFNVNEPYLFKARKVSLVIQFLLLLVIYYKFNIYVMI